MEQNLDITNLGITSTIQKPKRKMYLDITNKCQQATKDEVLFCCLNFVNLFITASDDICQVPASTMEDALLRMTNRRGNLLGKNFLIKRLDWKF